MILHYFSLLTKYLKGFKNLRKDDIILAAFPKSGSTWLRFIFCNIISLYEWNGKEIDFEIVNKIMVGLATNFQRKPPFKIIPKIVVTHRRYIPFFKRNRSILMIRDPRDVMVSYFNYVKGSIEHSWDGNFSGFIKHPKFGLVAWIRHYLSWKPHYDVLITYEGLKKKPIYEINKILLKFNIKIKEEIISEAIKRSSFENMKKIEERKGLGKIGKLKEGYRFVRKGKVGNWKDLFKDEDLEYLNSLFLKYKDELKYLEYFKEYL